MLDPHKKKYFFFGPPFPQKNLYPPKKFVELFEKKKKRFMESTVCFDIRATIRIGQEIQCLPYAGLFKVDYSGHVEKLSTPLPDVVLVFARLWPRHPTASNAFRSVLLRVLRDRPAGQ